MFSSIIYNVYDSLIDIDDKNEVYNININYLKEKKDLNWKVFNKFINTEDSDK